MEVGVLIRNWFDDVLIQLFIFLHMEHEIMSLVSYKSKVLLVCMSTVECHLHVS